MKIFYINLDKDIERRVSMQQQLSKLGLEATRIPGVYGKDLSHEALRQCYSGKKALRNQSRKLTPAEIGIAMSHICVYRTIVDGNIPCALILEDDVILPDGFVEALNDLETLVDKIRPEILLLSPANADFSGLSKIRLCGRYQAAAFAGGFYASSYIITRLSAQSLLKELYPVSMVADSWARLKKYKVIDIYVVRPCLIEQDREQFGSSTDADYQPFPNIFAKLIYKLRRARSIIFDLFFSAWRRKHHPYNDVLIN